MQVCERQETSPLTVSDLPLVCSESSLQKRYFADQEGGDCDTGYVQVSDGVVGTVKKDHFFVSTAVPQSFPITSPGSIFFFPFTTVGATQVLDCDNRWSNPNSRYLVRESGIYYGKIIMSVTGFGQIGIRFESVMKGALAVSQTTPPLGATGVLKTFFLQYFEAGDRIRLRMIVVPFTPMITLTTTVSLLEINQF